MRHELNTITEPTEPRLRSCVRLTAVGCLLVSKLDKASGAVARYNIRVNKEGYLDIVGEVHLDSALRSSQPYIVSEKTYAPPQIVPSQLHLQAEKPHNVNRPLFEDNRQIVSVVHMQNLYQDMFCGGEVACIHVRRSGRNSICRPTKSHTAAHHHYVKSALEQVLGLHVRRSRPAALLHKCTGIVQ